MHSTGLQKTPLRSTFESPALNRGAFSHPKATYGPVDNRSSGSRLSLPLRGPQPDHDAQRLRPAARVDAALQRRHLSDS